MNQKNRYLFLAQIIATVLYGLYGSIYLISTGKGSLWWAYAGSGLFSLLLGYLLLEKFNFPALAIVSSIFILLLNTHLVASTGPFTDLEMLFSVVLLFGTMEFTSLLERPYAFLIFGICIVFSIITFSKVAPLTSLDSVLLFPFYLLFIWRTVACYFHRKAFEAQLKLGKMNAYKSTIITLNHEFNNVGMILISRFKLAEKLCSCKLNSKNLEALSKVLKRFTGLINELDANELFEEEQYLKEAKMVKIKKTTK